MAPRERTIAGVRIIELTTPNLRVDPKFMGNIRVSQINARSVGVLTVTDDELEPHFTIQGESATQRYLSAIASGLNRFACEVIA